MHLNVEVADGVDARGWTAADFHRDARGTSVGQWSPSALGLSQVMTDRFPCVVYPAHSVALETKAGDLLKDRTCPMLILALDGYQQGRRKEGLTNFPCHDCISLSDKSHARKEIFSTPLIIKRERKGLILI